MTAACPPCCGSMRNTAVCCWAHCCLDAQSHTRGSSLGTLSKHCWFKCTLTMHVCFKHAGMKEDGQANVKGICANTGLETRHLERTRVSVNLDLLQFSLCLGQLVHWSVLLQKLFVAAHLLGWQKLSCKLAINILIYTNFSNLI